MKELQPQEYRSACLDRGLLVSLRDGELAAEETKQARAHLAVCPDCSADECSLQADSQEIYDLLASLGPAQEEIPDVAAAMAALQPRLSGETEGELMRGTSDSTSAAGSILHFYTRKIQQRQRWWIAAAAVVLITLVVLTHADALATQFLGLFQAQKFQPVSVNLQTFRDGVGEDLQSFGQLNIYAPNMTTISHPTETQIQQDLNFKLLLPGYLPSGVGQAIQFSLVNGSDATFTFNSAEARAYLTETGQGGVTIPPKLDGATFTITVAPGVIINYGKQCQAQSQSVNEYSPGTAALGCSGGKPFYVGEIPSPVIRATGKASLEDLRNFILSLPKLSPGARMLLQDVNLATGVVPLPIPPQIQAQQVTTHGAPGVLMVDPSLSLGAVLWQTGGIVYMVAGATSDRTQLMDSANSLH
jgi:hypothetical protein